ncbi:MAG: hypothetical protein QM762_12840 [Chryseolinea sp.]
MSCTACERDVPIENKDTGLCGTCNRDARDNSGMYPLVKKLFMEKMVQIEATCPVTGRPITVDDDVHHKWGRVGYADEEARVNGISLLIDVDYFLAVKRDGHEYIEANYEESVRRGWTIPRSGTDNRNR